MAVLSLAGCKIVRPSDAIGPAGLVLNSAIEKTHNGILLLNIVRSMHRMPQHWSALTTLNDTETGQIGVGIGSIPFGGPSQGYVGGATTTRTTSPSSIMQVQTSAEFTRAIMQPIQLEQVRYFLQQGWPDEFLFRMCIGRADVSFKVGASTHRLEYPNRPTSSDFSVFESILDSAISSGLHVAEVSAPARDPERVLLSGVDPSAVGPMLANGFKIVPRSKVDWLERKEAAKTSLKMVVPTPPKQRDTDREGEQLESGDQLNWAPKIDSPETFLVERASGDDWLKVLPDGAGSVEVSFHLRSPEGLIYYLGQVARKQIYGIRSATGDGTATTEIDKTPVRYKWSGRERTVFDLRVGPSEAAAMKVNFADRDYWVPRATLEPGQTVIDDRSLMTLTFAQLLINLNRSKKDLPANSIVTFGL